MIVADTSALLSLAAGDVLDIVLDEFDVHTTDAIVDELRETAEYEDAHARAAASVLNCRDRFDVHDANVRMNWSSRIDAGEASCASLTDDLDANFLITDDLRALPGLQVVVDAQVAISPIVLRALVERGVLDVEGARDRLETIAERRDWLGAPIFRRAETLFENLDE